MPPRRRISEGVDLQGAVNLRAVRSKGCRFRNSLAAVRKDAVFRYSESALEITSSPCCSVGLCRKKKAKMYRRTRGNMSMIKKFIKVIIMVFLIPIILYILFLYLGKDAWFWAMFVCIGNIMLLICSPNRKIVERIRKLGLLDWMFIWFVSLASIIFIPGDTLIIRIIRCATFFMIFIGFSVFGIRIMEELRKTKK
jgi:hypothetical protein